MPETRGYNNLEHIVLTSINPFSKLEYQKLCFEQWKKTGHKIITINSSKEKKILLEHGFLDAEILEINTNKTGLELFKKPTPRIKPILDKAKEMNCKHYLLTNSDIFPAIRKPLFETLEKKNNSIAFTRNECFNVASVNFLSDSPYRGGLDIFYFNYNGLSNLLSSLNKHPVSDRMAFGVPGWDFFIGYFIWKSDGIIVDSNVFFHQSHPTTYSEISEFNHYAKIISEDENFNNDTHEIAHEFALLINNECKKNKKTSDIIKSIFYVKPDVELKTNRNKNDLTKIKNKVYNLLEKAKIRTVLGDEFLAFLDSQDTTTSWSVAKTYRTMNLEDMSLLSGSLVILYSLLLLKKNDDSFSCTDVYPEGSLHGTALRQIIENTSGKERLTYLIDLFCAELIEHKIYNKELFKYLILEAKSKQQITLITAVLQLLQKK